MLDILLRGQKAEEELFDESKGAIERFKKMMGM